jgi:hypothetical protein
LGILRVVARAEERQATPDARPRAYFREASRSFADTCQARRSTSRTFRLGHCRVHIRYSHPALERRLGRALAHLEATDEDADLNICAFESARSGVLLPRSPFAVADFHDHGELRVAGSVRAVFKLSPRTLSMFDEAAGSALWWTQSAHETPSYERAAPFRTILHWWAQRAGAQLVHGAAVGTERGAVLLAGSGGSGKSTAALSCLGSGLRFAGDDYVLVEQAADPVLHSVYCSGKLTRDQLSRFPQLRDLAEHTPSEADGKSIIFLHDHFPHELVRTMPLRAIVLPVVTHATRPVIRRASPSECLVGLAPSTMFQHPEAERGRTFRALVSLTRAVPGFHLEAGPEIAAIPAALEEILSRSAR